MRRVIVESPYAGWVARNVIYARACVADCIRRGESPYASHLLYPGVLDDTNPEERARGIRAGFAWGAVADVIAVYSDLGISPGMVEGIKRAQKVGQKIEVRNLPAEVLETLNRQFTA